MFKHFIGSLVLASSLFACQSATQTKVADPSHPIVVAPKQDQQLDRDQVRAKLAARRDLVVERFLAYREARVYPVNSTDVAMQHVWMDENGNLCAAATLISQDMGRDAAIAVINGENTIALATVKDGPLADWMLTSGLTHHEIVAIQEPGFTSRQRGREPEPDPRIVEVQRLYTTYISVERQLRTLWDENLEAATDALMAHPDLAKQFLAS
jgi:hypothetical protein